MFAYVVRRVLATIPVMAVVALFVFSLLYIAPGDPAAIIAGDQATPADVERIRASLGLDRPFVVRFGDWLWHVLQGDLGTSIFTNLPVITMIKQRIEPTLSLMALTLSLSLVVAIPMGVVAAWKAGQHGTAAASLGLVVALASFLGLAVLTVMDFFGLAANPTRIVGGGFLCLATLVLILAIRSGNTSLGWLQPALSLLGYGAGAFLILGSGRPASGGGDALAPPNGPYLISILLALALLTLVAVWRAGPAMDRALMTFSVFGFSVPVFVVGYLLAYVFALELDWFPVQGYTPFTSGLRPWLANLVLPAIALGAVYIALIARITRATMLEVLSQDYVRTAKAKGVGQRGILFIHALKNAAVPIVTVVGIGFAALIGGAVVTESVFAIPGLGRLTVDAILRRDYPVIQGVVLLFSFVYVLVNLGVDLLYTVFDPRIRY